MILKGSQRGSAMELGQHLLKAENEHVELHELRGFVSESVLGAMKEIQAVSRGTRCRQPLFSVSFNPPDTESVSIAAFEKAIEAVETANGLNGQPRIVVFHEKEGRRHAHCVWSRIDADTMTARPLPFFKNKLREVSKGLYLEHGWRMPMGLIDSSQRDPLNFNLAEWQQAKREGNDPRALQSSSARMLGGFGQRQRVPAKPERARHSSRGGRPAQFCRGGFSGRSAFAAARARPQNQGHRCTA